MDGSRVSDFSIERILSPQLRPRTQVTDVSHDGYLHGVPSGFSVDFGHMRPLGPVPAPMPPPCCPQYRGMTFAEAYYPCGAGFHGPEFHPNHGLCVHFSNTDGAGAQLCRGYYGYQAPSVSPHLQHRQKARMRTVFTDGQSRLLEALFEFTDYPTVEARADVARRTGLSEETVRVWFKNRRARRKRHSNGAGVPTASSPVGGAASACCAQA